MFVVLVIEDDKRPVLVHLLVYVDDRRHHVGVDRVHVHAQYGAVDVLANPVDRRHLQVASVPALQGGLQVSGQSVFALWSKVRYLRWSWPERNRTKQNRVGQTERKRKRNSW